MTRTQQNEIILGKLEEKLRDQPKITEKIEIAFRKWFTALISNAEQEMAKSQEAPAPEAQGSEAPAPEAAPAPEG